MTIRLDPEKLIQKGAMDFGNSDFRFMKTTCCEKYIVYEHEVGHIYYDSDNLEKVCLEFSIDRCPICTESNWDFEDVKENENPQNWNWACYNK